MNKVNKHIKIFIFNLKTKIFIGKLHKLIIFKEVITCLLAGLHMLSEQQNITVSCK